MIETTRISAPSSRFRQNCDQGLSITAEREVEKTALMCGRVQFGPVFTIASEAGVLALKHSNTVGTGSLQPVSALTPIAAVSAAGLKWAERRWKHQIGADAETERGDRNNRQRVRGGELSQQIRGCRNGSSAHSTTTACTKTGAVRACMSPTPHPPTPSVLHALWNDTGYERQDGESRHHRQTPDFIFTSLAGSLSHSLCVSHSLLIMHPHSPSRLGDKSLCQITLG